MHHSVFRKVCDYMLITVSVEEEEGLSKVEQIALFGNTSAQSCPTHSVCQRHKRKCCDAEKFNMEIKCSLLNMYFKELQSSELKILLQQFFEKIQKEKKHLQRLFF